jgi:hypothetical protein
MSRIGFRTLRVFAAVLTLGMVCIPAQSVAAAAPSVEHGKFTSTEEDLGVVNICGDLADFRFANEGSYTVVDQGDGAFHVQVARRLTYTVTFLDASLGVWDATIVDAISVQSTPGGTFKSSTVANSFEGPVRIHEQTIYVVAADGTVRVDSYRIDVMGCPV